MQSTTISKKCLLLSFLAFLLIVALSSSFLRGNQQQEENDPKKETSSFFPALQNIKFESCQFESSSFSSCPAPFCFWLKRRRKQEDENQEKEDEKETLCVKNPHAVFSSSQEKEKETELVCKGFEKGDSLIEHESISLLKKRYVSSSTSTSTSSSSSSSLSIPFEILLDFHRFKKATSSWIFSRWFDFGLIDFPSSHQQQDEFVERHKQRLKRIAEIEGQEQDGDEKEEQEKRRRQEESEKENSRTSKRERKSRRKRIFIEPQYDQGRFSAKHSSSNSESGIFVMKNACFRSHGKLSGYSPREIKMFKGVTELETVFRKNSLQATTLFLSQVERLIEAPKLVLDLNVLVVPIDIKSNNPGHVFYRCLAARKQAKFLFGSSSSSSSSSSFHVIYLVSSVPSDEQLDFVETFEGYKYWYQLIGASSWSVVFEKKLSSSKKLRDFYSPSSSSSLLKDYNEILHRDLEENGVPRVCFNKVYVSHVCYAKCSDKNSVANQFQVPYAGQSHNSEHAKTLSRFRSVILRCLVAGKKRDQEAEEEKDKKKKKDMNVFVSIIIRRKSRIELDAARKLIPATLNYFYENNKNNNNNNNRNQNRNLRVQFLSQSDLTPTEFLLRVSESKILIGQMGGSLIFNFMMPSFSVVSEITGTASCSYHFVGFNKAPKCEFGSLALSRKISHFVLTLSKRNSSSSASGIVIGESVFLKVLRLSLCRYYVNQKFPNTFSATDLSLLHKHCSSSSSSSLLLQKDDTDLSKWDFQK